MKNKNGVSYRAEKKIDGERFSKTFKTLEAANAWIKELERRLKTAHPGSNQKQKIITVKHAMKILVKMQRKIGRDPRTIDAYLETLPHLEPILDINIADLKVHEVVNCFKNMRNRHNGKLL